ncbi:MAG: S41 family peptidase [Saprospiraceae bacterium]|nr:S41 family peptidase [Saprospiraceae bacterium]
MRKKAYVLALIIGGSLLILSFKPVSDYFEIAKNLDIFASLFKEVNTYYVDEIQPEELVATGIDAMLKSLDPYTNYIPEEQLDEYRTMTTGEYAGIGSLIGRINDENVITMPNKGFPADKAGIKAGDVIIAIDGTNVELKSTSEISKLLKGKAKTEVTITVKRYGSEEFIDFKIIRGRIVIKNVPYFGMVSNEVGFIKLTDFTTDAGREVKNAFQELKSKGAKSLILDLRSNPGGLLHEAVNVCNLFLPKGSEIVSTRGKIKEWNRTYKALNTPTDTEIPLVVLTNGGSASASEIVAGVMQDYDRGVIVGRKSFGKGLVQVTRPLTYNAQLKITTAKYYTPSGRCIQSLDYSNRNEDGSVGEIPDSLKTTFKTAKGRMVFDAGGVTPDIKVQSEFLSPVTISLIDQGLLFNYATHYYYSNSKIDPAIDFTLTDEEYEEYVNWLDSKNYDYETRVEKDMESLIHNARSEQYYNDIKDQIEDLKESITQNKTNDLYINREQIQHLLEENIASRYYSFTGELEASIGNDKDIIAAVEVLTDQAAYTRILQPKNSN